MAEVVENWAGAARERRNVEKRHELDRRDEEAFVDVLVYHGELLWNIEDLGEEYVRESDTIGEDFGNIDIAEAEKEWWD